MSTRSIGTSVTRDDAIDKVLGRARYPADLFVPHMLSGKMLGSPYPHAKIVHVDVSRAARVRGVKAVLTGADFPPALAGPHLMDMPRLARDRVRYVGEPIVAVAAVSDDMAEEALQLVEIEYEPLPVVLDPLEAMSPDAPLVHEEWETYGRRGNLAGARNVASHTGLSLGNLEEGFAASAFVFEDEFRTQMVHQAYTEPSACLAEWDSANRVTVWTTSKSIFGYQAQVAEALGIPQHQVRVVGMRVGGAFGGKGETVIDPICAMLAKRSARPVKMVLTRAEEFKVTRPRHPSVITIRTGVAADGTLLARHAKLVYDTGAYSGLGPSVTASGSSWALGPYHIPHARIDAYCVYTNKAVAGGFRGYGVPQATFASESQMDMIARRLGVDPLELRLKNLLHESDPTPHGEVVSPSLLRECLLTAAEKIGWSEERRPHHGKGIACVVKSAGSMSSSAQVRLLEDGAAMLVVGAMDVGQGSETALRQIVAEELGLDVGSIRVAIPDTDSSPWDWNTAASRVTHVAGLATQRAAQEARAKLLALAAEQLEASVDDLVIEDGVIRPRGAPQRAVPVAGLARSAHWRHGGPILGSGAAFYDEHEAPSFALEGFMSSIKHKVGVAVQAVEVRVEPDTAAVTPTRVVSVHDVGRAINPLAVEGQVQGAVVQGLGYALGEEVVVDESGMVSSTLLNDYRLPLAEQQPPIETVIVEQPDASGPYGAKGVGEHGLVGIAPAIAAAVEQAMGVRVQELPITPEKLLSDLESKP